MDTLARTTEWRDDMPGAFGARQARRDDLPPGCDDMPTFSTRVENPAHGRKILVSRFATLDDCGYNLPTRFTPEPVFTPEKYSQAWHS